MKKDNTTTTTTTTTTTILLKRKKKDHYQRNGGFLVQQRCNNNKMVSVVMFIFFISMSCCCTMFCSFVLGHLIEQERQLEYLKRNYTWPIPTTQYIPNTTGWINLMSKRLQQVTQLSDSGDRYQSYIHVLNSAILAPNFTEYGFGLTRCPESLLLELQKGIHSGLDTATLESYNAAIESDELPLFIDRPDLTKLVVQVMQPYVEAWVGTTTNDIELIPYGAYGFRLYQNNSRLNMHVDKTQTHIISSILHIDRSIDAEPWPIYIEDFHGRTHEVLLTPGDVLFYESSKCFHGRPKPFIGSWYTSVFVHYYPKTGWMELDHDLEAHYAVPPIWSNDPPTSKVSASASLRSSRSPVADTDREQGNDGNEVVDNDENDTKTSLPKLIVAGTSFKEPECIYSWCNTKNTIQWSGPGPADGKHWINPMFEIIPLQFHKNRTYTTDHDEENLIDTDDEDEEL